MIINKKRHLEMVLQSIPPHPSPKVDLEQYSTPAKIAADVLWNAKALGDIEGMKVADLACGTGIFAIGAALLKAAEVVGVDVDRAAVEIAQHEVSALGLQEVIRFISVDIRDFYEKADTVIQNPPFGAQKAHRKEADRVFISKSIEVAPVIYSFHLRETEEYVKNYYESEGGVVRHRFYYNFPIANIYNFHQKEEVYVEVVVLRVERSSLY